MTKANAEIGPPQIMNEPADRGLLSDEPGVLGLLPNVHRAAHHDQRVVEIEIGDRLASVELDRVPDNSGFAPEVTEDSGMFDVNMLKHQEPRLGCGRPISVRNTVHHHSSGDPAAALAFEADHSLQVDAQPDPIADPQSTAFGRREYCSQDGT